ncbi:MAG: hypothetical protein COX43_00280 [Parcubacteria group bacterium CG23_combo_of_CG06-09_8_20_14_all_35_9]|nr:MAG: hypothetical protein COX43_00280 [Parcubacteria group bacterium CG23_combo_of_CG06-09_8_20_14_all_35_9]
MRKEIKILKSLANEKRLEILEALKKFNELSVSELSQEINLHFKSTSKHLQKLVEAGLVEQRRQGYWAKHNLKKGADKILKAAKDLAK